MIGRERYGLYFLINKRLPGSKIAETSSGFTIKTVMNWEDFILWHKRLGVTSSKNLLILFADTKTDMWTLWINFASILVL